MTPIQRFVALVTVIGASIPGTGIAGRLKQGQPPSAGAHILMTLDAAR